MFSKKDSVQDNQLDNLSLSPETMVFLGLIKQPFSSIILSDDGIYKNTTLEQLLETSQHHLQFSDLVLIIEGPLGSGKTTLFRHFIQHDIPNIKLLPVLAEATDTLVQLQQKISIHLQDQGNANYLDDNLKRLSAFDQTPVLIIDDAHVLSDTTLQELIRYIETLKSDKETQLKLILFANKGMAETLEQISNLQHNQLFVQHMPELNPKQASEFLQHKLTQADYRGDVLFDEKAIAQILKKYGALPEQILRGACHQLKKMGKKKAKISGFSLPANIRPVILFPLLTLIAAVAIGSYFYLQIDSSKTGELALQPEIIMTPAPQPPTVTNQLPSTPPTSGPIDLIEPVTVEPGLTTDTSKSTVDMVDSAIMDTAGVTDTTPRQEDEAGTPPGTTHGSSPLPIDPPPAALIEQVKTPLAPEPEIAPVAPPVPVAPPAPPVVKKPTTSKVVAQVEPVKPKSNTTKPAINPALKQLSAMGIHDANWLLQQDKGHWTLQVLGARDPQTLLTFARTNKLGDDSAWYETRLNNRPWYILLHRFYTDQDIARQSIVRLPAGLQKSRPWVKSLDAVHKAIQP
ncbi:MAG: AAA family ATPase [Gammaproteobacteria bacterium]|nr:AAA family ATPase [Gammaproteobacteria bacterium]